MSEQLATNVTENGDTEGNRPRQDSADSAVLHGSREHRSNESQGREVSNASQLLGSESSDISVAQESYGALHEQPRKRAKRVIRSMPGSSCLRCKVKKTKCEPSEVKERICKRYVNCLTIESADYLFIIRSWAYYSKGANLGIMNVNILSKDVSLYR